jgi:hemolysin activation/secretion protein
MRSARRYFPDAPSRRGCCFLSALLLTVPGAFGAELVPRDKTGQSDVIREDQKRQTPALTPPPTIEVTPGRRAVKPVAGLKVDIKGFRFSGLTVVPEDRVQPLVAKFVGPGKSFDDLQAAADAVSEYLQQQGYVVAQVYLPEQSLEGGIVELAVLEGRLAQVRVDIEPNVPVSRGIIEGLLSSLQPGTIMHRDVLERALFLVSDLRGINVRSSVEAGASPGTSNLVVQVTPGRRFEGQFEFDNHSSRFTGDYRFGAAANINSPFGRGDLVSVRGLLGVPGGSADLDFGRISYLTPLGTYGTKVGAAYLRLKFHLGTSTFAGLDQSGTADVASIFALHPISRTRNFNLFGQASFDLREFRDDRRAVNIVSERKTRVGTFSLVGDSRDAWLRGGINNFSLAGTFGNLDIESAADLAADQSTIGRDMLGDYSRLNGTFTRLNALTEKTQIYVSYAFQLASKNLDASEKIGLGGPNAVRAYAVGEATSDEGHLFTLEARYGLPQFFERLPGSFVASAFFDYGRGKLNKEPLPLEANANTRILRGVGIGLTWARHEDFLIRASLAWRLSDAPISDPVDRKPRLYFQLQKSL